MKGYCKACDKEQLVHRACWRCGAKLVPTESAKRTMESRNQAVKTRRLVAGTSVIVLLAMYAVWVSQEQPINKDGYEYETHFQHADISNSLGVIEHVLNDTFHIAVSGDTVCIELPPDHKQHCFTTTDTKQFNPSYIARVGTITFLNMQPDTFYRTYLFPDQIWEVWPGTENENVGPYRGGPPLRPGPVWRKRISYGHYVWDVPESGWSMAYNNANGMLAEINYDDGTSATMALVNEGDSVTTNPPLPVDSLLVAGWTLRGDLVGLTDITDATGFMQIGHLKIVGDGYQYTDSGAVFSGARAIAPTFDVPGTHITLSADVWIDDPTGDMRVISKATGMAEQDHWWMLSMRWGDHPRFRLKTHDGITTTLIAPEPLQTHRWYHLSAEYDGVMMMLYVDGLLVNAVEKTGDIAVDVTVSVAIGNQPVGAGDAPWYGKIRNVMVWR